MTLKPKIAKRIQNWDVFLNAPKKGFHFKRCYLDNRGSSWDYCSCEVKDSIRQFLKESKYGLKVKDWAKNMAKLAGKDTIWYLWGVTLGLGALVLVLFLLLPGSSLRLQGAR